MQPLAVPFPALSHSVFRVAPPPLWYVTDGELTVGPVLTDLLIRGVDSGRVPDDCQVRLLRGEEWRSLDGVRELAKVQASMEAAGQELAEWIVPLERQRDEMEFCHTAGWLALTATGAEAAMIHYRGPTRQLFYTRAIVGPLADERLGHVLPETDPVLRSAKMLRPVVGPPFGAASDALAMRFAKSRGGSGAVAMIPIAVRGRLTALVELSRPGHAFRKEDLQRAERIAHRIFRTRVS